MRYWIRRKANQSPGRIGAIAVVVLLAALTLGLAGTILLPVDTSVRTTMKVLPFNGVGYTVNPNARGCGNYWDTRQVGHGVGATIQLAAGFCWNGKRVWWIWGLHQANCYPLSYNLTQVHMTCQIRGGGRDPFIVTYTAEIASSLFPFITRTVMLQVIVDPQGYVEQLPFQPVPTTVSNTEPRTK